MSHDVRSGRLVADRQDLPPADAALSAKLGEELNYEVNEATALAGQDPDWLAEFKEAGVWKIVDKKGADEVSFERTFGNEK